MKKTPLASWLPPAAFTALLALADEAPDPLSFNLCD